MSAPVAPVQERAAATRLAIKEAGELVVLQVGAFAATSQQVASAAGVSIGTFYRYFPNMPALLAELGWVAVKAAR